MPSVESFDDLSTHVEYVLKEEILWPVPETSRSSFLHKDTVVHFVSINKGDVRVEVVGTRVCVDVKLHQLAPRNLAGRRREVSHQVYTHV